MKRISYDDLRLLFCVESAEEVERQRAAERARRAEQSQRDKAKHAAKKAQRK